ncbi:CAP domain-containing protein [Rhodobacter ferrooxidans]|uniref:Hemolysin-type calcium-binding region n=1 Tax=Rhodobacter ferrooxidans TaxID=371731 RepID=C8RZ71_9RHOB|nr:CAP domain-containing protein [Rhodobacter sp. SW2]EEW26028.1 Hemolysin-type calcium-binding region [Rhodobacter sp. SW2]
MTITAAEQYGIELLNRARLDPLGEAARYGLSLNGGLTAGTITATVKQVLAPSQYLDLSAERHSAWILSTDTFSHTGINGTNPGQRMTAAGYSFTGSWGWAENLALASLGGSTTALTVIELHHRMLMESPGHRTAIMGNNSREIGYAQVVDRYTSFNASVVTENFAYRSGAIFVTGVAYNDTNGDHFYSMGEGRVGISFGIAGGAAALTAAAGGYGVLASQSAGVRVNVGTAGATAVVTLDLSAGNVKLDLVDGNTLMTSGNMTLISGVGNAGLLGVGALSLTGNAAANTLHGNAGANILTGEAGNDSLLGGAGNDRLNGGLGADSLSGEVGADTLLGGDGNDSLLGGTENDALYGDADNDFLCGDAGNDGLFGGTGNDRLSGGIGVDSLSGEVGADTLFGGAGNDRLIGGSENDIVYGDADNDYLSGDAGVDLLFGGLGIDSLYGGDGNDRLEGGAGADYLLGGLGADAFQFINGSGRDQVADFLPGQQDRLQLDDALWGGVALTDAQIVARYATVVGTTVVFNFVDGDVLTLANVTSLTGLANYIDVI